MHTKKFKIKLDNSFILTQSRQCQVHRAKSFHEDDLEHLSVFLYIKLFRLYCRAPHSCRAGVENCEISKVCEFVQLQNIKDYKFCCNISLGLNIWISKMNFFLCKCVLLFFLLDLVWPRKLMLNNQILAFSKTQVIIK